MRRKKRGGGKKKTCGRGRNKKEKKKQYAYCTVIHNISVKSSKLDCIMVEKRTIKFRN